MTSSAGRIFISLIWHHKKRRPIWYYRLCCSKEWLKVEPMFLQEVETQGHNGSNFLVVKANSHWIEDRFEVLMYNYRNIGACDKKNLERFHF